MFFDLKTEKNKNFENLHENSQKIYHKIRGKLGEDKNIDYSGRRRKHSVAGTLCTR